MHLRSLIITSTFLWLASVASASFTGLGVIGTDTTLSDGSPIWVLRFYAEFDDPTDRLLSITGASITAFPHPLYQHPFGTDTEPNAALHAMAPDLAFDSFVTMNRFSNSTLGSWTPQTSLEPGSAFSATGFTGGWFIDGDAPQTIGQLSYLIAQLSIEDYEPIPSFSVSVIVAWKTLTSGAIFTEGAASSPIPAPATLALFGLTFIGRRRRR
jgi:hypothetical protein